MRIVVGGESRKAGKTAAVCRIVAAFPEAGWAAVKVTPHMHAGASGEWSLIEDSSEGDTARYAKAGARRALLYCGALDPGLPVLRALLDGERNWIVESTTAARLLPHDLAILIEAPEGVDVKESAEGFPAEAVRVGTDGDLARLVSERWKDEFDG